MVRMPVLADTVEAAVVTQQQDARGAEERGQLYHSQAAVVWAADPMNLDPELDVRLGVAGPARRRDRDALPVLRPPLVVAGVHDVGEWRDLPRVVHRDHFHASGPHHVAILRGQARTAGDTYSGLAGPQAHHGLRWNAKLWMLSRPATLSKS